jgi:hypothetical protein
MTYVKATETYPVGSKVRSKFSPDMVGTVKKIVPCDILGDESVYLECEWRKMDVVDADQVYSA